MVFIYDRTQADVDYANSLANRAGGWENLTADEKAFWLGTLVRGRYTYNDTNRVEGNTQEIMNVLNGYGYRIVMNNKTDWDRGDFGTAELLENLLNNVKALANGFIVSPGMPALPETMENLHYFDANAIEQIQFDLDRNIQRMADAWYYMGDLYMGEV